MGKQRNVTDRRRVGQQLSFALYSASNRVIRLHRPFLEPLGLTYPQFLVMLALYESAPRTVGALGDELGMDNGTLTPLLKRLEGTGLLTRTRDRQDERRVLIDLTAAGEALRKAVCSVPKKIETACRLTDSDLAELRDTLNALAIPRSSQAADPPAD
jgi:DNA-binding MarR family transcriptional regulator